MSLTPGTRLGIYEVTAKIGEGGMGEVYRARDTKLDRDVALKVLPEAFTSDPDRLARFEREAKVTCPPEIVAARAVEFGRHDQEAGCHGSDTARSKLLRSCDKPRWS